MTTAVRRSPVLAIGIVVGLVMSAVEMIGGGWSWRVLAAGLIPLGYAVLVTIVAGRNETASALAGRPVDERWEHIGLEATSWAFAASAIVVLAAFVVTDASGGDWIPYAFVGAVMGVAYLGSLALVRLRH